MDKFTSADTTCITKYTSSAAMRNFYYDKIIFLSVRCVSSIYWKHQSVLAKAIDDVETMYLLFKRHSFIHLFAQSVQKQQ